MASLWRQYKGEAPKKLIGGLPVLLAKAALLDYIERWTKGAMTTKKTGMKAEQSPQNGYEYLLHANDKLRGIVWVELMSPPTKPDPGDSRVKKEPA